MPKIIFPNEELNAWIVSHKGDAVGSLVATKNIDLGANAGRVRPSARLYTLFDSADDADLLLPAAFIRSDADKTERYWAVASQVGVGASGLLWKTTGTDPLTGWIQDALTNSPTDVMYDLEIFGKAGGYDRLVAACDNDLAMTNNNSTTFSNPSWWVTTLAQTALSTSHPHQLHRTANLLLIADGNLLHVIDDSLVVKASRIVLPAEFRIVWMADDGYTVYLGTQNMRDGEAYVFPWRNVNVGGNETYDDPIPVYDRISFAGVVKDGILMTMNGRGQLLAFNGKAFDELDALPVARAGRRWSDGGALPQLVHPNGMKVFADGEVRILINALIENSISLQYPDMPAGVWAYRKGVGLYHKYGLSLYDGSTNSGWGAPAVSSVGALLETGPDKGGFLAGATLFTTPVALEYSIQASKEYATDDQRSSFVTAKMTGGEARALWTRIAVKFAKLLAKDSVGAPTIILKYRTEEKNGYPHSVLAKWVDGDTIDEVAPAAWDTSIIEAGDEVEVVCGKGAGALAHVASISIGGGASGATYDRIELDETIPNVAATNIQVVFTGFRKLGTITDTTIQEKVERIGARAQWLQLKVELRGGASNRADGNLGPEIQGLIAEFAESK